MFFAKNGVRNESCHSLEGCLFAFAILAHRLINTVVKTTFFFSKYEEIDRNHIEKIYPRNCRKWDNETLPFLFKAKHTLLDEV